MHEIPTLLIDLTLITLCAGFIGLLFKRLKQPVVLGYVLAGIVAGPYFSFFPSVGDKENIAVWAEIGVIFLLFGLGLEFSFKKIMNVGKAAMITASANIFFLLFIGYITGKLLGWTTIDAVFLGGMISMSSTTIIIKAFEELNMKKMRFTDLVFGVLVVEDIMGILLLVLLPTIALSNSINSTELLISTLKLVSFLILCFLIGIYVIPTFMKKAATFLNDEMLLLISIALCMGMVLLATSAGFSAALGAFLMGSILAESEVVQKIEHVIKPVKDFFGAVFFVSVGMMVDPSMFLEYWGPILAITLIVMVGKIFFSCFGFILSGQPLRTSILCGFSLAQVGEFAFIIAALGMSIGVLSPYVYPIIVAVSVITTFTTPLMIKSAVPFYNKVKKMIPEKWQQFIDKNTSVNPETHEEKNMWLSLFKGFFLRLILFSVICLAIMNVSLHIFKPYMHQLLPHLQARIVITTLTLFVMAPFLNALLVTKSNVVSLYIELWLEKRSNRLPLIILTSFRILAVVFLVMMTIHQLLTVNPFVTTALVILSTFLLFNSRWLFNQYLKIETRFLVNLNRDQMEEQLKQTSTGATVCDEETWLDSSLAVAQLEVEKKSLFADKTIFESLLQDTYAINIVRILREKEIVNIPSQNEILKERDILLIVGTKKQIKSIKAAGRSRGLKSIPIGESAHHRISLRDYILNQKKYDAKNDKTLLCCAIAVTKESSLAGHTILNSDIQKSDRFLVVGVERKSSLFINPKTKFLFKEGDLIWILGEQKTLGREMVRQLSLQTDPKPA